MGEFSRTELEEALRHYDSVVRRCSETGDWSPYADLFTEDVVYTEHAYGVFHGREQVREWITAVMAPFPHMRFTHEWAAFDEDNGAIVVCINNVLDHPAEPEVTFSFPNFTRIVYAGDNLFSAEEDVYNPARDAPAAVGAWIQAGGVMRADPIPMRHAHVQRLPKGQ
jgi:hypothetical protein